MKSLLMVLFKVYGMSICCRWIILMLSILILNIEKNTPSFYQFKVEVAELGDTFIDMTIVGGRE